MVRERQRCRVRFISARARSTLRERSQCRRRPAKADQTAGQPRRPGKSILASAPQTVSGLHHSSARAFDRLVQPEPEVEAVVVPGSRTEEIANVRGCELADVFAPLRRVRVDDFAHRLPSSPRLGISHARKQLRVQRRLREGGRGLEPAIQRVRIVQQELAPILAQSRRGDKARSQEPGARSQVKGDIAMLRIASRTGSQKRVTGCHPERARSRKDRCFENERSFAAGCPLGV